MKNIYTSTFHYLQYPEQHCHVNKHAYNLKYLYLAVSKTKREIKDGEKIGKKRKRPFENEGTFLKSRWRGLKYTSLSSALVFWDSGRPLPVGRPLLLELSGTPIFRILLCVIAYSFPQISTIIVWFLSKISCLVFYAGSQNCGHDGNIFTNLNSSAGKLPNRTDQEVGKNLHL